VQLLRDAEAMTPTQIAEALDLNPNTVKVTVRRMVDDAQLDTDGTGYYMQPVTHVTPVTEEGYTGDSSDSGYTGYRGYTPDGAGSERGERSERGEGSP
jgi:hypothetical protein